MTHSNDEQKSPVKLESRDQLFFKLLNAIWSKVLRNHPDYDGSDLGCDVKGYEMDPITPLACFRATEILCELCKRNLLCNNLDIVSTNDGLFEFEWWFTSSRNCSLVMNWTREDHHEDNICEHRLLFLKKISKETSLEGKYVDDIDDGLETEIRELCLARNPNDNAEDDKEVHAEFVEKLVTKGVLKGPGSKAFLNAFASFPIATTEKLKEIAENDRRKRK